MPEDNPDPQLTLPATAHPKPPHTLLVKALPKPPQELKADHQLQLPSLTKSKAEVPNLLEIEKELLSGSKTDLMLLLLDPVTTPNYPTLEMPSSNLRDSTSMEETDLKLTPKPRTNSAEDSF